MSRPRRTVLVALLFVAGVVAGQDAKKPEPRFLIVVPQKLVGELADFVEFKSKQLPTDVAILERLLENRDGRDDAERLKRALHPWYETHGVRWVLLVGDADVMPVRYMVLDRVTPAAFDYAFYPSDLYYADLTKDDQPWSFEDWNHERTGFHEGYFGEVRGEKNKKDPINFDQVDYRPEIAVGRWPVSTIEEVRAIASKSILRDQIASKRPPGFDRVGLIAVGGWIDARPAMDGVAKLLGPRRPIEKRYYADKGSKEKTAPPTEAEVIALINDGVGFLAHAGHGSDDSWEQCLSVASIDKLRTFPAKLPVMMSVGCSTARFAVLPPYEPYVDVDGVEHKGTNAGEVFKAPPPPPAVYQRGAFNRTGLGERLVREGPHGAAAYIGCNTGSQPCALTLLEGFAKGLGESKEKDVRLGDCWKAAVRHYWTAQNLATIKPTEDWYPASIFFQGMKFMLFGDPTLRM